MKKWNNFEGNNNKWKKNEIIMKEKKERIPKEKKR